MWLTSSCPCFRPHRASGPTLLGCSGWICLSSFSETLMFWNDWRPAWGVRIRLNRALVVNWHWVHGFSPTLWYIEDSSLSSNLAYIHIGRIWSHMWYGWMTQYYNSKDTLWKSVPPPTSINQLLIILRLIYGNINSLVWLTPWDQRVCSVMHNTVYLTCQEMCPHSKSMRAVSAFTISTLGYVWSCNRYDGDITLS